MEMTLEDIVKIGSQHLATAEVEDRFNKDQSMNVLLNLASIYGLDKAPGYEEVIKESARLTPAQHRNYLNVGMKRTSSTLAQAVYDNPTVAVQEGLTDKDSLANYLLEESKLPVDKFGADEWSKLYASALESHKLLKDAKNLDNGIVKGYIQNQLEQAKNEGVPIELVMGLNDIYNGRPDLVKELVIRQAGAIQKEFIDKLTVEGGQSRILGAYNTLSDEEKMKEAVNIGKAVTKTHYVNKNKKSN